jgi:hypothetical protein
MPIDEFADAPPALGSDRVPCPTATISGSSSTSRRSDARCFPQRTRATERRAVAVREHDPPEVLGLPADPPDLGEHAAVRVVEVSIRVRLSRSSRRHACTRSPFFWPRLTMPGTSFS